MYLVKLEDAAVSVTVLHNVYLFSVHYIYSNIQKPLVCTQAQSKKP